MVANEYYRAVLERASEPRGRREKKRRFAARVSKQIYTHLEDEARRTGLTIGEVIEELFTAKLTDKSLAEISIETQSQVEELLSGYRLLREDLVNIAIALLTREQAISLEQARDWVRKVIVAQG